MTAAPHSPIPAVCPELGLEVPVSQIDKELRLLWEQDEARTNASLINLVVYSEKHGALLENSAIVRNLTREHACRAILVEIDRDIVEPSIRAWITAHCHLAHGHKSVCCEQIALFLTGRVTGRFRNTVFAHLNSDLPLVFWWQGELSDILTERLVNVIDRLVVDSASWADPVASFRQFEEASVTNSDLILQDHAWTRTWQFRLGIASCFDDPVAQAALAKIECVELVCHPAHRNSGLQLFAWLAEQGGWSEIGGDPLALATPAGQAISVSLQEDPAGPPLSLVTLSSADTCVRVSQAAGSGHVERVIEAPNYRVASLGPVDPSGAEELLALQLARGGKNSLFQKILPRFRRMLEA